jgi:hypothetical protein
MNGKCVPITLSLSHTHNRPRNIRAQQLNNGRAVRRRPRESAHISAKTSIRHILYDSSLFSHIFSRNCFCVFCFWFTAKYLFQNQLRYSSYLYAMSSDENMDKEVRVLLVHFAIRHIGVQVLYPKTMYYSHFVATNLSYKMNLISPRFIQRNILISSNPQIFSARCAWKRLITTS